MLDTIISMFLLAGPSLTNYDKVISTIQQIAAANPANAKVISIGVNDQGVPIQALQIGSGEVGSLIVGTHHGNEYGIKGSFDPNRDYTGPCKSGKTFNLKSTKTLSDFLESKNVQISATLHT